MWIIFFCFIIVLCISIIQSFITSFIFLPWIAVFPILFGLTIFSFFWSDSKFSFRLFRINLVFQTFFCGLIYILVSTTIFEKVQFQYYVSLFAILSSPTIITGCYYVWKSLKQKK